LEDKLYFIDD